MQPVFTLLTPENYVTTQWSGGSTTQLVIAPRNAVYADRDFLWRISSATVELDESDFTALPDYRRYISTVEGDMTLSHNGGAELTLHPGDVHAFDGGDATHSAGRCTDFNLMLRKGGADGDVRSFALSDREETFLPQPQAKQLLIFCARGQCAVRCAGEAFTLGARESLLVADPASNSVSLLPGEAPALVMVSEQWESGLV